MKLVDFCNGRGTLIVDDVASIVTKKGIVYINTLKFNEIKVNDKEAYYLLDRNQSCKKFSIVDGNIKFSNFQFYKNYKLIVDDSGFEYYFYDNYSKDKKYLVNKSGNIIGILGSDNIIFDNNKRNIGGMLTINDRFSIYETFELSKLPDFYDIKVKRYINR